MLLSSLPGRKLNILLVLLGAIVLCFVGWYNNYPLFHWDSSVYIYPGFQFYIPKDRPIIYGLFVRLFSVNYSLWFVILTQGILLSLSVFYFFTYLTHKSSGRLLYIIAIFLLTFLTTASIHVSLILPDVFTSIGVINLLLLAFVQQPRRLDRVLMTLMFMLSLTVHNSHFVILAGLLMLITISLVNPKVRAHFPFLAFRRVLYLWGVVVLSYLLSGMIHYAAPRTGEHIYGHVFTTGQGGPIFLISKFNQIGILDDFLDKNCVEKRYRLCSYKDSIPGTLDFLWVDESPLYKTGGWYVNQSEYQEICFKILTTPRYLGIYVLKSFEASLAQFFSYDQVSLPVIKDAKHAHGMITACYDSYANEYLESRQNKDTINPLVDQFNSNQRYLMAGVFLLLCIALLYRIPFRVKWITLTVLATLFMNAVICASFSAVDSRYQSRVVWLLLLPLLLIVFDTNLPRQLMDSIRPKDHQDN